MRKFIPFFLVALLLLACGTVTITVPTEVPPAGGGDADAPDDADAPADVEDAASPRDAAADPDLPPTFTPPPTQLPPTPYTPRGIVGDTGGGVGVIEGETYVVQRGDTLAEIAAAFGVSLEAIARANNIANVDVIEVGDVLVIPTQ